MSNQQISRRHCIVALCSGTGFSGARGADETSWIDLTDDVSRSDLFERVIEAKLAVKGKEHSAKAVAFELRRQFKFPNDARFDSATGKPRAPSVFGIDLSHHNGSTLRFDTLRLQDVRFVYLKASQGVSYRDPMFERYVQQLSALALDKRIHMGAYHFLSAEGEPVAQAESFLKLVNKNLLNKPGDMPHVLDLEWDIAKAGGEDRWKAIHPSDVVDRALAWLRYVEERSDPKKPPLLYTARAWWRDTLKNEALAASLSRYRLWIADYSTNATTKEIPSSPNRRKWSVWQFTSSAVAIDLGSSQVDASIFNGGYERFVDLFSLA